MAAPASLVSVTLLARVTPGFLTLFFVKAGLVADNVTLTSEDQPECSVANEQTKKTNKKKQTGRFWNAPCVEMEVKE